VKVLFLIGCSIAAYSFAFATEPVVTAKKYMEYKRKNGHFGQFTPPKIVLVCFQQSTLKHLQEHISDIQPSESFPNLYLVDNGQVGILGGWGMGAPALSIRMEELIALGVKKFIAVGTAGTLMNQHQIGDFVMAPKALAEDGVAHLYLIKGERFAEADEKMHSTWCEFVKRHSLPRFHTTPAWSFSAMFRETPADVDRVTKQGCGVVEMEAATLYAIGHEMGAQTLSLFVISDSITQDQWDPHIKEPSVRNNLHRLAEWALKFCVETKADN
jgi:uridine phosphorylase